MTTQQNEGSGSSKDSSFETELYRALRQIAARHLGRESGNVTISPATLSHEAWIKLRGQDGFRDPARRHEFLALAGSAMRQVLIERARARDAAKRIPRRMLDSIDERSDMSDARMTSGELLLLDQALQRLALIDAELVRVVEYRFFGGLSIEETAEVLACSTRTVNRHWTAARAWLHRELSQA